MAKVINITDKFSVDKPKVVVGDKEYEVNDGMSTVLKFEELASNNSVDNMVSAISIALGEKAAEELDVKNMRIPNFKILTIAIMAAMQDMDYDEAAQRFQY